MTPVYASPFGQQPTSIRHGSNGAKVKTANARDVRPVRAMGDAITLGTVVASELLIHSHALRYVITCVGSFGSH